MTPSEFKAWFEGFTEAFSGTPTKAQWARIKARVGEIDGKAITERVFVDRWYPYIGRSTVSVLPGWTYTGAQTNLDALQGAANTSYNSFVAMNAVGRAEAATLAATHSQ